MTTNPTPPRTPPMSASPSVLPSVPASVPASASIPAPPAAHPAGPPPHQPKAPMTPMNSMTAMTLHQTVARTAALDPGRPAVEHGGRVTTYGELDALANGYAHALDCPPGSIVAVALDRSAAYVAAVLGVLKAGCVFLPMDLTVPRARQDTILADAAPAAVLTGATAPAATPAAPEGVPDEALAYCVYTSGSTGTPKGTLLTHEGLGVVAAAQRTVLGARPGDRVAQFASPGFDAFVFELSMALSHGGTLVLVPGPVRADPAALRDFLDRERITFAVLPPAVVTGLSRTAPVPGLRAVAAAGDVLPAAAVRAWPHPGRLFNLYGPTEATIWSTVHVCDPADPGESVPIGHPVPGVGVHLVDGEILLSGPVLARGYLGRPELTAERFTATAGVRAYRTGDLGRRRADGAIEFLGRRDHQVKVRGFRVELGEIEAALRAQPGVTDAVALPAGDAGDHLLAFVVPEAVGDLRARIAGVLPDFMVPARVRALPAFPLTPSGKPDRAALAALAATTARAPGSQPPRTPHEHAVARLWCDVLSLPDCGVHDPFHACGGHSLAAVRLADRITRELNAPVTVIDVLERGTVAELARLVAASASASAPASASTSAFPSVPVDPVRPSRTPGGPVPASAAQQQVAYAIEADGSARAYVARARLTLRGPLDVPALVAALRETTRRHEIFRTRFVPVDGVLTQRIEETADVRVEIHDAHDGSVDEDAVWESLVADVVDPTTLPLVRWALIRRAPGEHALLHAEHHYVHDGWSYRVFLDELATLYAGGRPPQPTQFAEFARRQHAWLESPAAAELDERWRTVLRDAPPPPALAALGPGSGESRGRVLRRTLPAATTARVAEVAARLGATPFQVMFGAFALLLSRYTRADDLLLGTTVANRTTAEWERVIGMIVNAVPVRVRAEGARTAGDVLRAARAGLLDTLRGAELPLSRIVAVTGTSAPRVLFSEHSALTGEVPFAGLAAEVDEALANDTAKFPLNVTVIPRARGTELLVEYAPARFDDTRVDRLTTAYLDLLGALHDGTALAEVDALVPAPGPGAAGNTYGRPWHGGAAARFAARAARHPDRTAVVAGAARWTYAELLRRGDAYAGRLTAAGVGPGDRVGIRLPRGPEVLAATLGVLRTGAAYVPLDPDQPAARTADLVARACLAALVDTPAPADPSVPADSPAHAGTPVGPDTPAYVSFTSGSTGAPKGVVVPHAALENVLDFFHGLAPDRFARTLALTPTTFDIANLELLLPVCHGGTVVIADRDQARDGDALLGLVADERVTAVQATPATWRLITAADRWTRWNDPGLLALCGGEALPVGLSRAVRARVRELWNVYGPTETTIWSTWHRCDGSAPGPYEPIGAPIAHTAVHLLDPEGLPVPDGATGEIHIGGAGVALGYLHQEGLTAERFVPDPYAPQPAPMYRTGDLARRGPYGLEFTGRADDQVKIGGHRVEPGEVEAALRAVPGVTDAVVLARTTPLGEAELVAFVTGRAEAVRERLAERLPAHLLPASVHPVAALPLTPNGKVDRNALLTGARDTAPDAAPDAGSDAGSDTGTPWSRLAGLIGELLPDRTPRPGAPFTAQGLHSLALMRLAARCRREYGVALTVAEVRACGAPAALAALLATRTAAAPDPYSAPEPVAVAEPPSRGGDLTPSSAQQRLWAMCQAPGVSAAYHIPVRLRLTGPLDTTALWAALERLVERHEALRTTFPERDGAPVARIGPARIGADDGTPFDLAAGPLIRAGITRESPRSHRLTITLHHLVADGWSVDLLLGELGPLYRAYRDGTPDPLPPPARPAARSGKGEYSGEYPGERYWRETLADAPTVLELPADRPRPPRQDHRGGLTARTLGPDLTRRIAAFGARHGTTAFETLTAAWAALLSRLSGQDDIVIGTPVADRDHPGLHDTVGFLVNTLALRYDTSGDPTVGEWAAHVRDRTRAALAHADVPFDRVVELAAPVRSPAHGPLFQAFVAWQDRPAGPDLPGVTAEPLPRETHTTAKFDLSLHLTDLGDRIDAELEYATALFDAETAERWLGHWHVLLDALLAAGNEGAGGERRIGELPLLTPQEYEQQINGWNATEAPFPDRCVHTWFEEQAARVPDRTALRHGDVSLGYAALDRRADRLARRLRAHGAGPGDLVAICAERGIDLVVAVLAVLKSGAAYVPLDPAHPPARLRLLLDGSAPVALVGTPAATGALDWPGPVLDPGDTGTDPDPGPDPGPLPAARPDDLAYVIHTSGSTGVPKGVLVEHRSVSNLLADWFSRYAPPPEGFTTSLWTSPGFDVSVLEMFTALAGGGTLHIVPDEVRTDAGAMVDWLRTHRIDRAYLPPFLVRALPDAEPLPLRLLLVGVEPLHEASLHRILAATPGLRIVNGYGPTEATVLCTLHDTPGDHDRPAPIGRPIANTRGYVLDTRLRPVPVGVPGELCLAGAGLARGYLGRDDDAFTTDPYTGGRLYRTGDLVRRNADGTLEFLGRRDEQIKIRGHRVEPGEIAAAVRACPGVVDAQVVPRDGTLIAYCVGDVEPALLRTRLAARLPAALVPAAYVRLPALPLLPSGKPDRAALPEPAEGDYAQAAFAPPEGETEQELARLWAGLLPTSRIGRDDDFFALGGHSLTAVRLTAAIRRHFDADLTLADVFAHPTLRALALRVVDLELASFDPGELAALLAEAGREP
ncbi:non-ribosomal peptide synthetase [Streptomyces yaizuensis]|uniref:Non-ribosomal peptide synthetase n=1 Tax=Streptomyces yaizuensis TaxID=2989713 RepID=A0ABQ5NQV6_9ACTN|nr:non-ribosomal peptide synthetase [Streptomyces sp. YSPA8]GLF92746.1 non-ribosomal peptide synthetase [Streptomyces sp. YSPA8]